jgi:hypothetical protein
MYDTYTKRQNATWLGSKEWRALKVGMQKSRMATTLTAFLDAKDTIHHEFVQLKQSSKAKFCCRGDLEIDRSSSVRYARVSGKSVLVFSARQCTGVSFGHYLHILAKRKIHPTPLI